MTALFAVQYPQGGSIM